MGKVLDAKSLPSRAVGLSEWQAGATVPSEENKQGQAAGGHVLPCDGELVPGSPVWHLSGQVSWNLQEVDPLIKNTQTN